MKQLAWLMINCLDLWYSFFKINLQRMVQDASLQRSPRLQNWGSDDVMNRALYDAQLTLTLPMHKLNFWQKGSEVCLCELLQRSTGNMRHKGISILHYKDIHLKNIITCNSFLVSGNHTQSSTAPHAISMMSKSVFLAVSSPHHRAEVPFHHSWLWRGTWITDEETEPVNSPVKLAKE